MITTNWCIGFKTALEHIADQSCQVVIHANLTPQGKMNSGPIFQLGRRWQLWSLNNETLTCIPDRNSLRRSRVSINFLEGTKRLSFYQTINKSNNKTTIVKQNGVLHRLFFTLIICCCDMTYTSRRNGKRASTFYFIESSKLKAENYIHLQDAARNDTNKNPQIVILPSSFVNSPRYLCEYTQDALLT